MSRFWSLKKLFKGKSRCNLQNDITASNTSILPTRQKFKASTRVRLHNLKAAFQTGSASSKSAIDTYSADDIDFSEYLPVVNGVGGGLGLIFEAEDIHQSQAAALVSQDSSEVITFLFLQTNGPLLMRTQVEQQAEDVLSPNYEASGIDVRSSVLVTFDPCHTPEDIPSVAALFVGGEYGQTTASVSALPQTEHASQHDEDTSSIHPEPRTGASITSPSVINDDQSTHSSDESDGGVLLDRSDQPLFIPSPEVSRSRSIPVYASVTNDLLKSDTSLSDNPDNDFQAVKRAIVEAPSAFEAQQALLDLADVQAAGETCSRPQTIDGDAADDQPQEATLSRVSAEVDELSNIVIEYRSRRARREERKRQNVEQALEDQKIEAVKALPDLHRRLERSGDEIASLKVKIRELEQEKQELDAEVDLLQEKKRLTRNVNKKKVDELEAENKVLALKNFSLEYNARQSQILLNEERKKSEIEAASKNAQIARLEIDQRTSKSKIDDLEAKRSRLSIETSRQASDFHQSLAEKDEQLAMANAKIVKLEGGGGGLNLNQLTNLARLMMQKHRGLMTHHRDTKIEMERLSVKHIASEAALREAQTEAWTKTHLHEEVCRTLELSKQMHKETIEASAALTEKYEKLETRYNVTRQVSERMLADSMQASAAKDERINLPYSRSSATALVKELDKKQVQIYQAESRLVATQRLAESLKDQLQEAKSAQDGLELENKKLECQLGEVKVRLDHDFEDEERLKTDLANAKAQVEDFRQSADGWKEIANAKLDSHSPEIIKEMCRFTISQLQERTRAVEKHNDELFNYTKTLKTKIRDLEYELGINARRLNMDESVKLGFYEHHWSKVGQVFDDNNQVSDSTPSLTIEEHMGPEYIDRQNAMYRAIDEARETRGEDDIKFYDLGTEKVKAIFGHGPAGFKLSPLPEMPEGFPDRIAARAIEDLRAQVRNLKAEVWELTGAAEGGQREDGSWETEEKVEDSRIF
jgi:hypothetical protein